jgi:hypothetical protein
MRPGIAGHTSEVRWRNEGERAGATGRAGTGASRDLLKPKNCTVARRIFENVHENATDFE